MLFFTYPQDPLPPQLENYILLSFDGPMLSNKDCEKGILLIDGTWRYAQKMEKELHLPLEIERRSLPTEFVTAYPRKQQDCPFPERGLSSVEALFVALWKLNRNPKNLLDHYYWKNLFLEKNRIWLK